jgi:hypothetical protein
MTGIPSTPLIPGHLPPPPIPSTSPSIVVHLRLHRRRGSTPGVSRTPIGFFSRVPLDSSNVVHRRLQHRRGSTRAVSLAWIGEREVNDWDWRATTTQH